MEVVGQDSTPASSRLPRVGAVLTVGLLSFLVLALWQFPRFWYTKTDAALGRHWLSESTNITGWTFREIPVSKAAEAVLVADRLTSGEFTSPDGKTVRVFSAKRYAESGNEIGLFVHTPDRCWTESGWTMSPVQPEYRELDVHGIRLRLERRVFVAGAQSELVYFAGLVAGQPLPYRLDHNLSVGMKHALRVAKDGTGTTLRASDRRFWGRIWEAFVARRPLNGPKQFIRVSTAAANGELDTADQVLERFLPEWLASVDYEKEIAAWRSKGASD